MVACHGGGASRTTPRRSGCFCLQQGECRAGSREGAGVARPPIPENQFENGAKFLCLKGKGSCTRNALMLTAVATKSLKIVIFNHLMLVDANCDDSVTIPRCPNLVVDLKVSVCGTEKNVLTRAFWAPPYFKSWIQPWRGGEI